MPQQTDAQSKVLKSALESVALLATAAIVHDRATHRVVVLQRSENAKPGPAGSTPTR
ncbi:hypothetical protein ACWEKU_05965 [Streptomyces californicus]